MPKKKIKNSLVYAIPAPVEMVEADRTPHDPSLHKNAMPDKSQKWYDFWGKKCPICKAEARIVLEAHNGA